MTPRTTYILRMPRPESHYFEVEIRVNQVEGNSLELVLPLWAPGSYLIREFARHVEAFDAMDDSDTPVRWRRLDKHRWEVQSAAAATIVVRYRVYAFELTVRTSHLDASHGYFNGSNLFMYVVGRETEPLALEIEPPPGWHTSIALPQDERGRYVAADYDELADSPGEIGTHRRLMFEALGVPHEIALWGRGNEDERRLVEDTRRIIETVASLFGSSLPYDRYLFIVHLGDGLRGGLEHRASTTLAVDRWAFGEKKHYQNYLRLTAHEFFHTWHVKRIRPAGLGPFDYTREVYTPLLWVMEGFTTYYDVLLLARAGLIRPARFLEILGERVSTYLQQPGRLVETLEESSQSAWIRFYRKDENYVNSGISYYLKGSLVALMLDMGIREASRNARSLDDVMRALWEQYGRPDIGFTSEAFETLVSRVAGVDLSELFERYARGLDELPLAEVLETAALRLELRGSRRPSGWIGALLDEKEGTVVVRSVLRDSPAERAGLAPGDRLIAIDGYQIRSNTFLTARLRERAANTAVRLHLFRDGELLERAVTPGSEPATRVELSPVAAPTPLQREIFATWIGALERHDAG